ncbi:MAG TPA: 2-hydroxyacid dehydrogenase [Acidimicrobiales bacterium]|nr:2-hydroxyacid dehydrogenase [Acidimicrobiales bacterium]
MAVQHLLVTFEPSPAMREALSATIGARAEITYLPDLEAGARTDALGSADVVLAWVPSRELKSAEEFALLGSARLLQLLSAGVDQVPLSRIPEGVPVASNAGSYAGPMAEHVLAMALALAKHLPQRHADLEAGVFAQHVPNREIRGSVVCILGFGGIGRASALLFHALGARVQAVSRSPVTDEWVERVHTLDALDVALADADIVVIALPLTTATRGRIAGRELSIMKPEAIVINVARAAIVDEDALYEHLASHPAFQAGIDVWWEEPRGGAPFSSRRPFLELPNVLGSPHNSGTTEASFVDAVRDAAANVVRALEGETIEHLVDRREYVD